MVYFYLIAAIWLLLLLSLFKQRFDVNVHNVVYTLTLLIFSSLIVFRDVGLSADDYNYLQIYQNTNNFDSVLGFYNQSYFYAFLNYLSNIFGFSYEAFAKLISVVILINISTAVYILLKPRVLYASVLLVFLMLLPSYIFMTTNAYRQGLAFGFLLLLIVLVLTKKSNLIAWMLGGLAVLSHASSVVVLPLIYLLMKRRYISEKVFYISGLVFLFVAVPVVSVYGNLVPALNKAYAYQSDYNYSSDFYLYKSVLIIMAGAFFISFRLGDKGTRLTLYYLSLVFVIIYGVGFEYAASRFSYYLEIGLVLLLAQSLLIVTKYGTFKTLSLVLIIPVLILTPKVIPVSLYS